MTGCKGYWNDRPGTHIGPVCLHGVLRMLPVCWMLEVLGRSTAIHIHIHWFTYKFASSIAVNIVHSMIDASHRSHHPFKFPMAHALQMHRKKVQCQCQLITEHIHDSYHAQYCHEHEDMFALPVNSDLHWRIHSHTICRAWETCTSGLSCVYKESCNQTLWEWALSSDSYTTWKNVALVIIDWQSGLIMVFFCMRPIHGGPLVRIMPVYWSMRLPSHNSDGRVDLLVCIGKKHRIGFFSSSRQGRYEGPSTALAFHSEILNLLLTIIIWFFVSLSNTNFKKTNNFVTTTKNKQKKMKTIYLAGPPKYFLPKAGVRWCCSTNSIMDSKLCVVWNNKI